MGNQILRLVPERTGTSEARNSALGEPVFPAKPKTLQPSEKRGVGTRHTSRVIFTFLLPVPSSSCSSTFLRPHNLPSFSPQLVGVMRLNDRGAGNEAHGDAKSERILRTVRA